MAGFCGNCGTKIEDGMMVCPNCGTKVSGMNNTTYQTNGYAGMNQNNEITFISSDEKEKEKIQATYVGSFLRGNGLSKSEAVCTDKRFYFSGMCFENRRGSLIKSYQEWIVDLEDITASGFKYSSNIFLLILSILVALWGFAMLIKDNGRLFLFSFLVAVIIFAIYWFSRKTLYVITFAGGSVAVDASQYGMVNAQKFNHVLRTEKQKKIENML